MQLFDCAKRLYFFFTINQSLQKKALKSLNFRAFKKLVSSISIDKLEFKNQKTELKSEFNSFTKG